MKKLNSLIAEEKEIICPCLDINLDAFITLMKRHRLLDFEKFLQKTGVGMRCTACRLNLELIYEKNFDALHTEFEGESTSYSTQPQQSKWRKLLGLVDKMMPDYPMYLRDFSPVFAGNGLDQRMLVTNDAELYDSSNPCEPVEVTMILRDCNGLLINRRKKWVGVGDCFEAPLSNSLIKAASSKGFNQNGNIIVGNVEIRRRWRRPSVRGTTRPQILLRSTKGCGSVHTQGPNGSVDLYFSALVRSGVERVFISLVNAAKRQLKVRLSWPQGVSSLAKQEKICNIHGYGANLVEIINDGVSIDIPISILIESDGPYKPHILCSTPSLDSISIDHPAES